LATGLTGKQGVMIPAANRRNLMCSPEVVDAVRQGQFHIWSVSHVDEGIELLTHVPAGTPEQSDTVMGRVMQTLRDFSERWKSWHQA
jgi:predicted ATP-dependent protease